MGERGAAPDIAITDELAGEVDDLVSEGHGRIRRLDRRIVLDGLLQCILHGDVVVTGRHIRPLIFTVIITCVQLELYPAVELIQHVIALTRGDRRPGLRIGRGL